jgi:hypothetical protein
MYRTVISCSGVPDIYGPQTAADIAKEFAESRPWQQNVTCIFENGRLILTGESDVDSRGLGLYDEFWDCVCAYLVSFEEVKFNIESVTEFDT